MHLRVRQAVAGGLALAMASATLGGVAQAHDVRYRGDAAPRAHVPYGPADPCARQAAERRLGWGIVGLLAGGLAGGAAAGAGVVAEGAGLGGLVGALAGGKAGSSSAACGTAALAARAGNYPPFEQPYGQAYGYGPAYGPGYAPAYDQGAYAPQDGGYYQSGYAHPTYAYGGPQPVTYYEYRRVYRSYPAGPCCQGAPYPQAAPPAAAYDQGPPPGYYAQPAPYGAGLAPYAPPQDRYGPPPGHGQAYGPPVVY